MSNIHIRVTKNDQDGPTVKSTVKSTADWPWQDREQATEHCDIGRIDRYWYVIDRHTDAILGPNDDRLSRAMRSRTYALELARLRTPERTSLDDTGYTLDDIK